MIENRTDQSEYKKSTKRHRAERARVTRLNFHHRVRNQSVKDILFYVYTRGSVHYRHVALSVTLVFVHPSEKPIKSSPEVYRFNFSEKIAQEPSQKTHTKSHVSAATHTGRCRFQRSASKPAAGLHHSDRGHT